MVQKKLNIAIVGATGYVGLDLVFILSKHPKVQIKYLCAQKNIGKSISFFDKRIKKKLPKISLFQNSYCKSIDLIFLSLPNGEAQKIIKKNIHNFGIKFIDLSADFRIKDPKKYKKWYGINHFAKDLISKSIYSISEFVKKDIKKFRIIANPGCYPTSIQLPLVPLLKKNYINTKTITIDSKSGYSGAGKNIKKKFNFENIFSSISAYGIEKHKHMSELDQEFFKHTKKRIDYTFNPHLIPTYRGLLSSIYLNLNKKVSINKILNELKNFHKNNHFIKIKKLNVAITTGDVKNTNYCTISVCKTRVKNKIVIFSAIDNLVKGASGQAIQNMNILFGFREDLGL